MTKTLTVFAAGAHPDDIEFMMGGTLLLLKKLGCNIHYMNIANGCCGTAEHSKEDIIAIRTVESENAARAYNGTYHPPLVDDLEIYYERALVTRASAVVREVAPDIMLLPSPQDYMEDHSNTSRVMVSAAFYRNMKNYVTDPPRDAVFNTMAVYHAMPYGLKDQLRKPIAPDFYTDISTVIEAKRNVLGMHTSQKEWLDRSQGMDSYLNTMTEMSAEVGRMSGRFEYAEGWRRHSHLGFAEADYDPLRELLADHVTPKK